MHLELFAAAARRHRAAGDRRRARRLRLPGADAARRPASSRSPAGAKLHARRPLPRSGAGGSGTHRLLSFRSAAAGARVRRAASAIDGPARRDPADAERADRGRDRRLRAAAPDLPLPTKEVVVMRRLAPLGARRARARRLRRRLVRAELPDDRRGAHVRDRRLRAGRRRSSRGKPTAISFVIRQPDGQPLTKFKRGAGPHTGVHLIFVRDDLATIIHKHPPVARRRHDPRDAHVPRPGPLPAGRRRLPGERPAAELPALPHGARRRHGRSPSRCPPPSAGRRDAAATASRSRASRKLKAIQATLLTIDVTDAQGRPATFKPYYGALAHAIFFRQAARSTTSTRTSARPARAGCTSFARRRAGRRHLVEAGPADGRRARPGAGHVAPLPPDRRSAAAW